MIKFPGQSIVPFPMKLVLGIDCGGTQTRAVLAQADGHVLGHGLSGPGNFHSIGLLQLGKNIQQAVDQAWQHADRKAEPVAVAFLGMAGVSTQQDRKHITAIVQSLALAAPENVILDHDLSIALAGSTAGKAGIVLISGTGSACYGCDPAGKHWRSGGWGRVLDDLGSAFDFGRRAMIAAVRHHDGRGPKTSLSAAILQTLQLEEIAQLKYLLGTGKLGHLQIAAMSRLVTAAAGAGDKVANKIISQGVDELALMAKAVYGKLDFSGKGKAPIAVAGGLRNAGTVFLRPLQKALAKRAPNCEPMPPSMEPVLGAVLLACKTLDVVPQAKIIARLRMERIYQRSVVCKS